MTISTANTEPLQVTRRPRFTTTSWTMVRMAGEHEQIDAAHSEQALNNLLEQYLPAVRLYVIAQFRFSPADTDDLLQGFVLDKILRGKLLGRARKAKGKFRSFLLTAVNHYVVDHLRTQSAKKRIPKDKLVPIAEEPRIQDMALNHPPSETFDLAFVRQVLAMAIHRCHGHCQARGMNDVWRVFSDRVLGPVFEDTPPVSFKLLAEELGLDSIEQARNRLVSAKRIFQRELRAVILDYSESDQDIETEIIMFQKLLDGKN